MSQHQATTRDADTAAIRLTIAEAEKYQAELEPFVALHTADAVIVNIAGRRVLGRNSIHEAMRAALDTSLAKVFTRTEIVDIRFVAPDVTVVSCVKHVSDQRDAAPKGNSGTNVPARGSLTYVLAKEHGAWRIAAAQTTPVVES